jgi:hypothetical protein
VTFPQTTGAPGLGLASRVRRFAADLLGGEEAMGELVDEFIGPGQVVVGKSDPIWTG